MALLKVENIQKSFRDEEGAPRSIIEDISFSIREGEFVPLLGPSGCGKTTLLTMLGGFQKPSSGRLLLDEEPILSPGVERGYVFQNYALFPWKSVRNNILYSLKVAGVPKAEQEERLKELLELAQLNGHEKKYPIQLSGGMQQRVAVVRALASRPRVLLLDEPLGAVDFQMREILQNELAEMVTQAAITVLMVTHDVSEAVYLSDRVLVMGSNGGELMTDMAIELPRPRQRLSRAFRDYTSELTDIMRLAFRAGGDREAMAALLSSEQKEDYAV